MSVYTDVLAKAKAHQRRNGTRATAATPPPPVNRLGPETELEPSDDLPLEGIADWPAPLSAVAMPGLVGDMLGVIGPQTEADPAALLLHLLVFFGSCAGRAAYFAVGGTWHHANLFGLCVGPTSEGRKGTARDAIARPFQDVDPEWLTRRMMGGLASGEGLVWAVRDASKDGKDEGVTDKRLCVFEAEYAAPLRLMAKDGNVLGSTLRQGWDRGELANLSKNSPATATGAHLSLVGHISVEELRELLRTVDMANGFLNRHLLVMVRRSQLLPEGGRLDSRTLSTVVQGLRDAVDHARKMGEMQRDAQAREQWAALYAGLSTRGPGLLGAVLGRAEAQVARLSLVYA
ncbi:MAG TPA: hypothetical protein VLV45_12185, partial [Gemmatimonadales bacterium]|nr:hypothetical protein [Gemmatimonadales bacterium]